MLGGWGACWRERALQSVIRGENGFGAAAPQAVKNRMTAWRSDAVQVTIIQDRKGEYRELSTSSTKFSTDVKPLRRNG